MSKDEPRPQPSPTPRDPTNVENKGLKPEPPQPRPPRDPTNENTAGLHGSDGDRRCPGPGSPDTLVNKLIMPRARG
jgi:hypothetical protein